MIFRLLKLVLFILLITLGVFNFIDGEIGNGIFLTLLSGIPLLFYFKNEMMFLAFLQVRKQNLEKANSYLNKIKNPEKALIKGQRGYYYFLKGIIESQKNMNAGDKLFKKALSLGLRYDHDKAMAKLQLASVAIQRRRKQEATRYINEAKKLDKRNLMSEQISMVKAGLKRI